MSNYSFSTALEMLRQGEKMQRAGWNGKGMFVYFVAAASYPASRNTMNAMAGVFPDDMVPYQAYIAMKTADDTVVPWLASQTDLLAKDWQIAPCTDLSALDDNEVDSVEDIPLPVFKLPLEISALFESIKHDMPFTSADLKLAAKWFVERENEIGRGELFGLDPASDDGDATLLSIFHLGGE